MPPPLLGAVGASPHTPQSGAWEQSTPPNRDSLFARMWKKRVHTESGSQRDEGNQCLYTLLSPPQPCGRGG